MKEWVEEHHIQVLILAVGFIIAVQMVFYPALFSSATVSFELMEGLTRSELSHVVGDAFAWPIPIQEEFFTAYTGIQWDAFNQEMADVMTEEFGWQEYERDQFLQQAAFYMEQDYDVLSGVYIPGVYEFVSDTSPAMVSAELVRRVENERPNIFYFLRNATDPLTRFRVQELVNRELEFLPDLIPYPPQNLALEKRNNRVLLVFDTTYYNMGRGNLELIADSTTAGMPEDIERNVFQRISRVNGTVRERSAGIFLWHQEHLHYHFADFIEYILKTADERIIIAPDSLRRKSTFCIRDVSRIITADTATNTPATYFVCGKERQGVSVGWGDTYFFTYADQNLDITELPSGRYTLSFFVNPTDRFDEVTKDNNMSSVVVDINKEEGTVEIIASYPEEPPRLEHVHIE